MEKLPKNTSEAIRFSGGLSKLIRNMDEQMNVLRQGIARAGDLISFYEKELRKIVRIKILHDDNYRYAIHTAKQALKTGEKI